MQPDSLLEMVVARYLPATPGRSSFQFQTLDLVASPLAYSSFAALQSD
jgi:hypothetical protein